MAIFNSYVSLPEGTSFFPFFKPFYLWLGVAINIHEKFEGKCEWNTWVLHYEKDSQSNVILSTECL